MELSSRHAFLSCRKPSQARRRLTSTEASGIKAACRSYRPSKLGSARRRTEEPKETAAKNAHGWQRKPARRPISLRQRRSVAVDEAAKVGLSKLVGNLTDVFLTHRGTSKRGAGHKSFSFFRAL